ncbi:MAG TPA: tyrosine-protein phosphatase, partial [Fibrobacteria bacterium]|nr:tyrosine-protein phosphatase [Fibrobacteria bacterium]
MNKRERSLLFLIAAGTLVPGAAAAELRVRPVEWAQPVIGVELGNFYQVSGDVYRSRQPDDEEFTALSAEGIRSVLSLREYHADQDKAPPGLRLYALPMNAGEIDDAKISKAMLMLAEAPKPVLVHCWHGSDRTGVVIAMYRMVFQDWPREKAIDEFENGGFGYHKSVYPNIERYLETVDVDRFKALVRAARQEKG